jgi:hypothetical protein
VVLSPVLLRSTSSPEVDPTHQLDCTFHPSTSASRPLRSLQSTPNISSPGSAERLYKGGTPPPHTTSPLSQKMKTMQADLSLPHSLPRDLNFSLCPSFLLLLLLLLCLPCSCSSVERQKREAEERTSNFNLPLDGHEHRLGVQF